MFQEPTRVTQFWLNKVKADQDKKIVELYKQLIKMDPSVAVPNDIKNFKPTLEELQAMVNKIRSAFRANIESTLTRGNSDRNLLEKQSALLEARAREFKPTHS